MIKIFFLFLFVFIVGCSNEKQVYWCGDHECANKNERIKFFKENLIVEVKVKNSKPEAKSKISKIIEQKNKQVKIIKSKKILIDEIKTKKKINKKKFTSKTKKKNIKKTKKNTKVITKNNKNLIMGKFKENKSVSVFESLVEKVKRQSSLKPFPDINIKQN